ncbi:MAG TPA: retropepsin-like aspartic protease [Candidatus Elarobacter sp.]|jgi:hypothetical protein
MSTRAVALFVCLLVVATARPGCAIEWRPPDLRPTKAVIADVLAAYANHAGPLDARSAQRRERWTYVNGTHRFPVDVAIRGDDYRVTVTLGGARYAAGRSGGVRWRADANGIAHATLSDEQGDAADRVPSSVFPFALSGCRLAGESERFGATWVLVDRPRRDKPHWLYVDRASGAIAHEITREGARTVVATFDRWERAGSSRRPAHWRVSDGNPADDVDVTVDAVDAVPVAEGDVAIPQTPRLFAAPSPSPSGAIALPAHFRGRTIFVDVDVDGRPEEFVLDTGTASIMLDRRIAQRRGWQPLLDHATVPRMRVGPLRLDDVSTLTVPLEIGYPGLGGILGYDFFFGHVVHIDYARARVEVLTREAAEPVFAGGGASVVPASYDEGVPLVHAAFGRASGERFLLDTGSPHLFVMSGFADRYAKLLAASWPAAAFAGGRRSMEPAYLEGSIRVAAREAPEFELGPVRFGRLTVGVEEPNGRPDAIDVPVDAIVGTDQMALFEWWFDYDGGRIAIRRNAVR